MGSLEGKNIVLGITGGIAAYKSALLARLLVKEGAVVQVVMTPHAKEFIAPLTLSTLTGRPVLSEFFNERTGEWHSHVNLGVWADFFVVAPLTACTLSKMVYGQADNLLVTTYLSSRGQCVVAPAMDLDMYAHPSTQQSLTTLRNRGVVVVEPEEGFLASGLTGKGRMAEPTTILKQLQQLTTTTTAIREELKGKRVLVTSGPTFENIDPVRFIGNYSSGTMGKEIAQALVASGAVVEFISGPVHSYPQGECVHIHKVRSASEMLEACKQLQHDYDIAIFCAAVADYRPAYPESDKIKREGTQALTLELIANPDIAATLGKEKGERLHIGFALETNASEQEIQAKMRRKNLDLIVHNSLNDPGAGFGTSTNKVTIYTAQGQTHPYPLKSKRQVAQDLLDEIVDHLKA